MTKLKKEFGFYPEPIRIDAGPVRVRPLPEHAVIVDRVLACDWIQNDWMYARPAQVRGLISNEVRTRPYSSRVFRLPYTHTIEHATSVDEEHLEFHVWVLSFFLGMRLTATQAGFLDATPIKSGKLVDFVLRGQSLVRAVELAERFWIGNRSEPRNALRFKAAVHALFLGQYPQSLQFERFIYLYTAIDACYALGRSLRPPPRKHTRVLWMCTEFGVAIPKWAKKPAVGAAEISIIRNDAVHEALFMDAPFGFAVHGESAPGSVTLEMRALVCRFLVALIGGNDVSYLGAHVNSRQRQGLHLR